MLPVGTTWRYCKSFGPYVSLGICHLYRTLLFYQTTGPCRISATNRDCIFWHFHLIFRFFSLFFLYFTSCYLGYVSENRAPLGAFMRSWFTRHHWVPLCEVGLLNTIGCHYAKLVYSSYAKLVYSTPLGAIMRSWFTQHHWVLLCEVGILDTIGCCLI